MEFGALQQFRVQPTITAQQNPHHKPLAQPTLRVLLSLPQLWIALTKLVFMVMQEVLLCNARLIPTVPPDLLGIYRAHPILTVLFSLQQAQIAKPMLVFMEMQEFNAQKIFTVTPTPMHPFSVHSTLRVLYNLL